MTAQILADSIKDNDRIVDAEADDGQRRGQEEGIQLPAGDQVHNRKE